MQKSIDIAEVTAFIKQQSPETKVYIGCDSVRFRINGVWYADYSIVIVVHINGKNGCKIFGEVQRERDYDQNRARPIQRMMSEAYKVSELYQKLEDVLAEREVQIHLDINPNKVHGSSCAVDQAVGFIKGVCGVTPLVKPSAFCASFAADRFKALKVA